MRFSFSWSCHLFLSNVSCLKALYFSGINKLLWFSYGYCLQIFIFLFFYDDSQYIGAVRYHVGGRYYNIIDDYTNNVVNIDFEEEVQYFFDIIYGLDR